MTATYHTNVSYYPLLIWLAVVFALPIIIWYLDPTASTLDLIVLPIVFLQMVLIYLDMKLLKFSIEDDILIYKKIFQKEKSVPLSKIKYAKRIDNNNLQRLLFGTPKHGVEAYGKWGLVIFYPEDPDVFLKDMRSGSKHFS